MLLRFRSAVALLPILCVFSFLSAGAQQAPIALPYTMTTIAGTSPMTAASGTQCPNLLTGVKSTDVYGDGCLAVNGIFGAAARGGVQVDSFGNVFVADDVDSIIHVINPTSGIMSALAGGGSVCAAATGAGPTVTRQAAGGVCLAAPQPNPPGPHGTAPPPIGRAHIAGYMHKTI